MSLRLSSTIALAFCFLPSIARAGEPAVVLLSLASSFPDDAWPEAERRTFAELSLLGFSVFEVAAMAADVAVREQELAAAAAQHNAVAAVLVARSEARGGARVWLHDRPTGRMTCKRVPMPGSEEPDAVARLAFQIVELLRASLVELRLATRARAPEPSVPVSGGFASEGVESPASPAPRMLLGAGLVAAFASEGPYTGGVALTIGYQVQPTVRIEADLLASAMARRIERASGAAAMGWASLSGFAIYEPWPDAVVAPGFGLGCGAGYWWTSGAAQAGYRGQLEGAFTVRPAATAQVAVRLTPALRAVLHGSVGALLPVVDVYFAGERVTSTGPAMIDVQGGLEWRL